MKNNVDKMDKKILSKIDWFFKDTKFTILFISVLSLVACLFLFKSGLIKGHDLEYHLSRISAIAEGLKSGNFKALIHDGFSGYGYANGLFYSNIFLYFPAILNAIGMNVTVCYKIFIVVCTLLTTYSMFYCMKKITKSNKLSALSSLIYTMCAYRICDVMVRAAVGEIISFIFIPIVILGLYELIFGDYKKFYIFSIGFVGLVNCHLISTVLVFIVVLLICIKEITRFINEPKRIKYLIFSGLLGLLLAAFFILPMLEQYFKSDLLINTQDKSEITIMPFFKIFFGLPNFKTRFVPGGIGLIFIYSIYRRFKMKEKDELLKFSDLCMWVGVLTLLASTDLLPWNELCRVLGSIQFTYRLFFISSAFLSVSAGIVLYKSFKDSKHSNFNYIIIFIYIIVVCILNQMLGVNSLKNYYINDQKFEYLTDYKDFTIASGEYLPAKTDWSLIALDKRELRTNNGDIILTFKEKNQKVYIDFENNTGSDTYIDVPLLYYLGYRAKSIENNNYYSTDYGYNTWIRVNVGDVSKDSIVVWYKGTRIERISCIVSLISWLAFIAIIFRIPKLFIKKS